MEFQSTKGAVGVNLPVPQPPTTLLPSSSARCSMQGRNRRLPGPKWEEGERTREEEVTGSLSSESRTM